MTKEIKYLKTWNKLAGKALHRYNQKRGEKYYKIYEYCMYRRTLI